MIGPGDPRHGERLTYNYGCRCQECRDAAARYERGRQWDILQGKRRHVPILGTRRRLQALVAIGWTYNDQARHLGVSNEMVYQWATVRQRVTRATADRVAAMYDALSMTLPPQGTHAQRSKVSKARNYARRNGFAPPLAYDDDRLDDPSFVPLVNTLRNGRVRRSSISDIDHNETSVITRKDIDEAVVVRLLNGENLPTNRAEREEIMRRWLAQGGSEAEMCRRMGWRSGRYVGGEAQPKDTNSTERKAS